MAFTPKAWHDRPDLSTPITASSLQDLEMRLAAYSDTKLGLSVYNLAPSGDTTGTTDDTNFSAAVSSLPNGGVIYLMGNFNTPFYTKTGWVLPAQTTSGGTGGGPVCLQGLGCPIIRPVGAALTGIKYHRTSNYNQDDTAIVQPGTIRDITIDGVNATGASRGLSVGDGMSYRVENVLIKNFTGSGARGALFTNTLLGSHAFYCEKSRFQVFCVNNTDNVYITAGSGSSSWEYNIFDVSIIADQDQRGVVIDNASLGGCHVSIMGNFSGTSGSGTPVATTGPNTGVTIAMLSLVNTARIWNAGSLVAKVERSGGTSPWPYTVFCDNSSNSGIQKVSGHITTGMGGFKMGGAECSFSGMIGNGDYTGTLADIYPSTALPASGVAWVNGGPDALVRINGGTVTAVALNGVTIPGLTATQLVVPAATSLTVTYSSAPTMTVIPLRVSQS
jgi:hypothetical protein